MIKNILTNQNKQKKYDVSLIKYSYRSFIEMNMNQSKKYELRQRTLM